MAPQSIQLSTRRDVGINHQKMEFLLLAFLMNGADQHTAGFDAHHGSGRQIRDGDAGLTDQLFRLIICVNTAQNRPFLVRTVIQSELQKLFGLLDGFAFEDLHGPEIGLGEGLRLVVAFLPRSKRLLISWPQSPAVVIWEPPNKVCHCFHCFPMYLP